ncbi:regulator of chromosome condensation (RCC1) [Thraustotheca clavata]|uniref:Regulator of chromosome condensation (RCC1) n=1 Tax=Thraustotheca clavata TaxID=74557 RepID=A0A1V9ZBP0_9STRA|nr:regulator of chromosome condensation (RCC1) [Thraustotheca clavata]
MVVKRVLCHGGFGSFGETKDYECDENDEIVDALGGHSITIVACKKAGVVGWGQAFHGELGKLKNSLKLEMEVKSIACGGDFVLLCTSDGNCFQWGKGIVEPTRVVLSCCLTQVAAGEDHALALNDQGLLWTWGNNEYGQCGHEIGSYIQEPTLVAHNEKWKYVAAGTLHTALIAQSGALFTCGWGQYNQLGHGNTASVFKPMRVESLDGVGGYIGGRFTGLKKVACGAWHTVALTTTGDVYSWGWGQHGQLCGPILDMQPFPTLVDLESAVLDIACGTRLTALLTDDKILHRWGTYQTTCTLSTQKSSDPNTTHSGISVPFCQKIVAGAYHTLAMEKSKA